MKTFFRSREVQHKRRNTTVFKRCYAFCASEAHWGILVLTASRSLLLTHPMVQVNKTYPARFCFGLNIPRSIRIADFALKKAFLSKIWYSSGHPQSWPLSETQGGNPVHHQSQFSYWPLISRLLGDDPEDGLGIIHGCLGATEMPYSTPPQPHNPFPEFPSLPRSLPARPEEHLSALQLS